jgi:alginate O-acetyltransferase complex protein AlgI
VHGQEAHADNRLLVASMLFNSLHFVVFFIVVFSLTALLRRRVRERNIVLLIAGYYFYAWWDWRFLSLLWITTLFDYFCGRMLRINPGDPGFEVVGVDHGNSASPAESHAIVRSQKDKWFVAASMVVNLTILGFFKYFNFFVDSAAVVLGKFGLQAHAPVLHIILPLGISFYTFQSMNYVIDVYRGELEGEKSLLNFALFVSFFPHLVAGPILRATALMPQIKTPNEITWEKICSGFYLFVWGLFKKVVIADNIAAVVDRAFGVFPATFDQLHATKGILGGGTALMGIYAFAIQIYCDFSGYTDMARGTARMLGFELMHNFDLPYFAANASDFWRRWHISLSSWLRDYLYIPLGGNRKGNFRTYVNLMITMLLGGLWHGAAWTFVIWGGYHGSLLCIHHGMRGWLKRNIAPKTQFTQTAWLVLRIVIFFHFTCFGWLLFRAVSMEQVAIMMKAIFTSLGHWEMESKFKETLAVCAIILFVVQLAQAITDEKLIAWKLPIPMRAVVYAMVFLGVIIFGGIGGRAFIYFQF